jgi:hypothetical protein
MSKLAKKVLLIALLITIVSLSSSAILIYLNQDNILENIVIND